MIVARAARPLPLPVVVLVGLVVLVVLVVSQSYTRTHRRLATSGSPLVRNIAVKPTVSLARTRAALFQTPNAYRSNHDDGIKTGS